MNTRTSEEPAGMLSVDRLVAATFKLSFCHFLTGPTSTLPLWLSPAGRHPAPLSSQWELPLFFFSSRGCHVYAPLCHVPEHQHLLDGSFYALGCPDFASTAKGRPPDCLALEDRADCIPGPQGSVITGERQFLAGCHLQGIACSPEP